LSQLEHFVYVTNSKLGTGYVYGGQSEQPLTREVLGALVKQFGKEHYYFSNCSAEKWLGKEYYDSSGLIVNSLRRMGLIPINSDYSADMIYNQLCAPITKNQLKAGDLCFNNTNGITHVGMYMGNGRVIHARGTFYGVVNTQLFDSFNTFGRLKFFQNETDEAKITFAQSQKRVLAAVRTERA
jgi:cell wall-associated NlpC family hydrolase